MCDLVECCKLTCGSPLSQTAEELQSVAAVVSDAARESRRHKEEDKEECGAAGGGSAAAQEQESFEARMKAQTKQVTGRL